MKRNTIQNSPEVKRCLVILAAILFFSSTFHPSTGLAQFDDFPPPPPDIDSFPPENSFPSSENEFGGAPPEAAPSASTTNNAPASSNSATNDSTDSSAGGLSKSQKDRLSKASIDDINDQNFPDTIESFDFPNVDIQEIVKAISELTGKNFIIDPGVRGKITIIAPSKITVAEAYKAFLSALAINGYTVVPSGSFLKIKAARDAQRDSIETYAGSYYPTSDQMITKIIHLKHVSAESIHRELRQLTSKVGDISPYASTNSLIISDYGSSIDRIVKIVAQLDVQSFEEKLEVIGVKYAKAKDMAELIDRIINKGQPSNRSGGNTFSSGVPRFSGNNRSQNQGSNFTVIPDDRTNSLIIVGNNSGILRVKKLIAQLDFKVNPQESGGVYVYYVRYGNAEEIAKTLQGVTKDAGPTNTTRAGSGTTAPGGFAPPNFGTPNLAGGQASAKEAVFGGEVKVTADKNTNSLVITASKQDYENVLSIISQLDIARDQVFVEALIMELTMSDGLTTGAGFYKFSEPSGKAGFSTSTGDVQNFLSPLNGAGSAILGFASGTVTVTDPTSKTEMKLPSLIGFLNFIKQFGRTNVLSTPSILAMDNQEAEISVGDSVVTRLQTQIGTNGSPSVTTPELSDAEISLKIKPFISPASNDIRMEILQKSAQVSTIKVPSSFEGQIQPLAKRSIKTNISVPEGDTVVLGGLMKDEELETIKKVPLLGDLPLIGWLFKGKSNEKKKVNMLVFLTPKIIRNKSDSKMILDKKMDERLSFIKSQGGRDPFGSQMSKITNKAGGTQNTTETQEELDIESTQ